MRYRTGIKTYLKLLLRPSAGPTTKFIIFSRARSGSTLLAELLNSNPWVECEGEILQAPVLFPGLFIRARSLLASKQAYGCKLLSYQLRDLQGIHNPQEFLGRLHRHGFKIIYLVRQNIVWQQLSNLYAFITGTYHHRAGETLPRPKVRIDPHRLRRWLEESEELGRYEEKALQGLSHLGLIYEDDLLDGEKHQSTLDRVCAHLGVPSSEVRSDLIKVTPKDPAAFIENAEEVMAFLRETKYSRFLDHPV